MLTSNTILIIYGLFMGFGAYLIFLWAVNDGQLDNCEQIKYQLMDDDDDYPSQPQ